MSNICSSPVNTASACIILCSFTPIFTATQTSYARLSIGKTSLETQGQLVGVGGNKHCTNCGWGRESRDGTEGKEELRASLRRMSNKT